MADAGEGQPPAAVNVQLRHAGEHFEGLLLLSSCVSRGYKGCARLSEESLHGRGDIMPCTVKNR